ncbi:unnamed protein product, partial [marine sediment metagenome]
AQLLTVMRSIASGQRDPTMSREQWASAQKIAAAHSPEARAFLVPMADRVELHIEAEKWSRAT